MEAWLIGYKLRHKESLEMSEIKNIIVTGISPVKWVGLVLPSSPYVTYLTFIQQITEEDVKQAEKDSIISVNHYTTDPKKKGWLYSL